MRRLCTYRRSQFDLCCYRARVAQVASKGVWAEAGAGRGSSTFPMISAWQTIFCAGSSTPQSLTCPLPAHPVAAPDQGLNGATRTLLANGAVDLGCPEERLRTRRCGWRATYVQDCLPEYSKGDPRAGLEHSFVARSVRGGHAALALAVA